jgi:hypothetical protein
VVWVQAISLPAALAAALATGGLAAPAALLAAPWAVAFTIGGFVIGFVLHMMALARVGLGGLGRRLGHLGGQCSPRAGHRAPGASPGHGLGQAAEFA